MSAAWPCTSLTRPVAQSNQSARSISGKPRTRPAWSSLRPGGHLIGPVVLVPRAGSELITDPRAFPFFPAVTGIRQGGPEADRGIPSRPREAPVFAMVDPGLLRQVVCLAAGHPCRSGVGQGLFWGC